MPFPVRVAEPERAVPAGRLDYDIAAGQLLLHTIQTAGALDALISDGTLIPDPALAEPDFADAYDWMRRQMTGQGARGGLTVAG